MLILERHSGESIQINNDTKLTIYYNKGSQIKIGIDAPRCVSIVREELVKTTEDERLDLAQPEIEITDEKKEESQPVIIKTKRKKRIVMPNY